MVNIQQSRFPEKATDKIPKTFGTPKTKPPMTENATPEGGGVRCGGLSDIR